MNNLKIKLTDEEREDCSDIVAISFAVNQWGVVFITEHWDSTDELYSDGCTVKMPQRIWLEGMKFVTEELAKIPTPP